VAKGHLPRVMARRSGLAARLIGLLIVAAGPLVVIATPAGGGTGTWKGASAQQLTAATSRRLMEATSSLARTLWYDATQPSPTTTPRAPGITIAALHNIDMPDPFVLAADGRYYLYLSNSFGDPTNSNIPVLAGTPGHWGPITEALPNEPSWALSSADSANTWDPDVVYLQGRYVMYFAPTLDNGQPNPTHCIGLAVSSSPAGPFVPVGDKPLICQLSLGGDIDAQLFSDPEGPKGRAHPNYLVFKSDNNNLPGSGPTTIWAAPMSNDGLTVAGRAVPIFQPGAAWEEPILEAPQMVLAPNGTDWLFFSSGTSFYDARYAMGAAVCDGPMGGCRNVFKGPLIASNKQGQGPGEETVFVGPDHSTWLIYNPWYTNSYWRWYRPAEAARIGWSPRGPYVAEAGRFPSPIAAARRARTSSAHPLRPFPM
jgi:GH43 family beta-xylosidase